MMRRGRAEPAQGVPSRPHPVLQHACTLPAHHHRQAPAFPTTPASQCSERQKARLDVTLRKSPEFDRIVAEDAKASSARKPTAHE